MKSTDPVDFALKDKKKTKVNLWIENETTEWEVGTVQLLLYRLPRDTGIDLVSEVAVDLGHALERLAVPFDGAIAHARGREEEAVDVVKLAEECAGPCG